MARILAVDDRAINREFLATLLTYAGHEVLQASDGAQALEIVREKRPDLVITDVLMPVMDGVEFADRVHEDNAIAHTPIIFYTATYRLPEAKLLGNSCSVVGVLAKPAEPQEILDAVGIALGARSAAPLAPNPALVQAAQRSSNLPKYLRDLAEKVRGHTGQRAGAANEESGGIVDSFQALSFRLSTLLEFDLALAAERHAQGMVDLFCRASQDIIGCGYVAVGILDKAGRRLQYWSARSFGQTLHTPTETIDALEGVLGDVVASGKPFIAHAAQGLDKIPGLPGQRTVHSLLVVPVPVRSSTSVHGWLYLAEKNGGPRFEGEDEQFAITLATQFALTFGNHTLYDEIQQHAAKLEMEVRERRRTQEELAHRITHDQTTGLPRFALIEDHLHGAFREAREHAGRIFVFYVDIDRFHSINETRGRELGDEVLRAVGDRLAGVLEEGGQLAHVAADEFACVLVDMHGVHRPAQFAEKIRRSIEKPMQLRNQRIYVTCSVGVSSFPETGSNPQDLLRQAEAAMLRAKQEGRNTVWVFANEQKQELEERKTLGLLLPEAIRLGQFELHYQPQIGSNDGQVMGFEALLRWHSPEYGLLPPVRFLGIAEELGLTIDIGSFVLESVCRQTRAWLDAGAEDFSIAVNVSSLQLQRPDFVDSVRAMLQRWNVPAQYLELELTENMMIDNVQRVIDTMRALKSLGLKLALDDFGTGYSSLNYLRHFPIDTLKIDQSFVRNISTDPGAAGICRAVISLGHQLGMTVLAEGVESAAQAGYLRRSGCDRFQGFYFARPMTAEHARELLDSRFLEHEGLAPQQETLTLLLLDDEENILNALKRSLRREGYRILTATDAEQAFDVLARNNVEVILSDQRIPGASGTEFLSKVKELYPDTVRMMLSGYTNLDAVTDAINRGAIYKFLMKPWKDAELREQIHEAFRTYKSRLAARNAPGRETES